MFVTGILAREVWSISCSSAVGELIYFRPGQYVSPISTAGREIACIMGQICSITPVERKLRSSWLIGCTVGDADDEDTFVYALSPADSPG